MNIYKIALVVSFAFGTTTSFSQNSEIYSPFSFSNSERLDYVNGGGYCKNAAEEKKLWTEINKFAKSFLLVVPTIPPEQKAYIQTERNSSNNERLMRIMSNSFYIMNDLYEEVSNVEQLSSTYLKNQAQLPLAKKMEIIGRTLANFNNENIPHDELQKVALDLRTKGYYISAGDLGRHWAVKYGMRRALISHLICYGEKLN
jgi:hypothetical protein